MLRRFQEAFGSVDVLLVTGDHVAHDVAPDFGAATSKDWDAVKANLQASAQLIQKYFPDTLVLTSIGNNDGYHNQAVKTSQKAEYYGFVYDLWFEQNPGDAGIAKQVKETIMSAGYYRADVTDKLSVLAFNGEYMDIDDDTTQQGSEATEQLDWLEAQLLTASSSGRKFILTGHVYPGARYHANALWHEEFTERYF